MYVCEALGTRQRLLCGRRSVTRRDGGCVMGSRLAHVGALLVVLVVAAASPSEVTKLSSVQFLRSAKSSKATKPGSLIGWQVRAEHLLFPAGATSGTLNLTRTGSLPASIQGEQEPSTPHLDTAATPVGDDNQTLWTEVLTDQPPYARVFHNFLNRTECLHLVCLSFLCLPSTRCPLNTAYFHHQIHIAAPHMKRATVVKGKSSAVSDARTNTGFFLRRGQDSVVQAIEERIAAYTRIPFSHGEPMQVLRYEETQQYRPHPDYLQDPNFLKNGGQRIATILSELVPDRAWPDPHNEGCWYTRHDPWLGAWSSPTRPERDIVVRRAGEWSSCGMKGLSYRPRRGDALFWFNLQAASGHEKDYPLDPLKYVKVSTHNAFAG
eukprot:scaffold1505_cov390-Prasinococcus_capsulatus_cf.AAC.6